MNIIYNGTWQGPSFAPRMKAHPSLPRNGLPQNPFPAPTHTGLYFSLSSSCLSFYAPL